MCLLCYVYIMYILCYVSHGVTTIRRILENTGLYCKRALQKRPILCKETYIFKHPTNRSHPIPIYLENTYGTTVVSHDSYVYKKHIGYNIRVAPYGVTTISRRPENIGL